MILAMRPRPGPPYGYRLVSPASQRRTRSPALWCLRLWLISVVVISLLLVGCGSSKPKPDPVREARLVTEMNAFCTSRRHRVHHATQAQKLEVQHRLATLVKVLRKDAAYLPAGRSLNEALRKQQTVHREQLAQIQKQADKQKHKKSGPTIVVIKGGKPFILEEAYLRVKAYKALKALGLTRCLGKPPRPPSVASIPPTLEHPRGAK
jgi:hypothetical protein